MSRILVADDSLTIQKVIRLALSNEGYEIEAVSDGNDAAQQIPLFRPHVILVDVGLPGRSAYDLKNDCNQEAETRNIKFVLMSSAFETVEELRVTQLGFAGRLVKPFDPAHLRKILTDVLSPKGAAPSVSPPPAFDVPATPAPTKSKTSSSNAGPSLSSLSATTGGFDTGLSPLWAQDDDIKTLTEQTIKLTGLDKVEDLNPHDWKLNEPARKPQREIELEDSGVEEVGERTYGSFHVPDPALPPPKRLLDTEDVAFEFTPPSRSSATPREPTNAAEAYFAAPDNPFQQKTITTVEYPENLASVPVQPAQIEDAIKHEVREAVEKVLREQLPNIAEKIIRDEIQKMLSSPP